MNPFVGFVLTFLLLAVNAYFVAGEFAVTSSRRSTIEPLANQGHRGAKQAMFALEHVSLMLAICQLGITVASTSLGVIAEPAIAQLIATPLEAWGVSSSASHVISFALALLLVLLLHVVFAEMVPKNLSIAKPDRALFLIAPSLVAIGKVVGPLVHAMDNSANWFVRRMGLEPRSEVSATFTLEEVATILEVSREEGKLEDELGLLSGTLEFTEELAGTLMVTLDRLVTIASPVTPESVEALVTQTGFSRFPVVSEEGKIEGYVHLKDALYAPEDMRDQPLEPWRIRELQTVKADEEAESVLREMQVAASHMVGVVEGEELIGVLFLEDLLEELVGQVRDSLQRVKRQGS